MKDDSVVRATVAIVATLLILTIDILFMKHFDIPHMHSAPVHTSVAQSLPTQQL